MSLRPASARWFELLTARDSLTISVEALARTGSVELETHSETRARINLPDLQERMAEYNRLGIQVEVPEGYEFETAEAGDPELGQPSAEGFAGETTGAPEAPVAGLFAGSATAGSEGGSIES